MVVRVIGILICAGFVLWVHRGEYPIPILPPRRRGRELGEALFVLLGLLLVPRLDLPVWWFPRWLGPWILFGVGGLVALALMDRRRPWVRAGFQWPRNRSSLGAVGGILGLMALSKIVDPLQMAAGYYRAARGSLMAVVLVPMVEEILFRGLLQTRLEAVWKPYSAWVITGMAFAAYHFYVNHLLPAQPVTWEAALALLYLGVFGMLLGVIFAKTRSLLPPFVVHAMNNLLL